MSYPEDLTAPIVEWYIDGAWVDLTAQDRLRTEVQITRGRQNEQGTVSPTTASYTLDSSDGALNNRNPNADYYRQIPVGTRQRVRAGDGDNHVYMRYGNVDTGTSFTSVRTTDKAALDIVGDLEVRVDVRPWVWRPAGRVIILASKYRIGGDQRSWALYLTSAGRITFVWTTDGTTATRVFSSSTVSVPATTGRLSIKATMDVNNGAAGNTVRFYTATSIDGTYTQLGADVVTAGVTSIFSGTANLVAGSGDDNAPIFTNGISYGGRFYGLHLYNSAGTRVANPDFTTWDLDDTAVADGHSNTWDLSGQARITSPRIRFWGELTSAEQVSDTTGQDVTVPVQAADLTQALGDKQQPVQSPLELNIAPRAGILGRWGHEDGTDATAAGSGLPAGPAAKVTGAVTFGNASTLAGAARVAVLTTQGSKLSYRFFNSNHLDVFQTVFLFKMPATLPVSEAVFATFTLTAGAIKTITIETSATTFGLNLYGTDGALVDSAGVSHGSGVVVEDQWIAMRLKIDFDSAPNINWEWAWYQQGSGVFWGTNGSFIGVGVGYPTGAFLSAQAAPEFAGMQLSHFVVAEQDLGFAESDLTWSAAIDAYAGETAAARVYRITTTNDIYCEIIGEAASSVLLGPQPIDTPMKVLRDVEAADGGYLTGLRDFYGLVFRTRQDIERHRDAGLDYATHLSEVPKYTDDASGLVNDVTVSRKDGSSARAQIVDGPNSISDPPDGVGVRPSTGGGELNVATDGLLPDIANLRARYGSFDQARVPNLVVELHRPGTLPTTVAGLETAHLDVMSTIRVTGWPTHLPPDPILFLTQGYTERLARLFWQWKANTTPAGPYQTGLYDVADQPAGPTRYGSSSSTLNAGVTTTATTLVVAGVARVTTVEVWTTVSARYPLDVMVGGEQITLGTPPSGSTSPQTFTNVTRSVNGIVRAHDAGEPVRLHNRTYYGK